MAGAGEELLDLVQVGIGATDKDQVVLPWDLDQHGAGHLLRKKGGVVTPVLLTSKGWRLQQTIYAQAGSAQQRIAEILGPRRFAQLHSSLELLTEQLAGTLTGP